LSKAAVSSFDMRLSACDKSAERSSPRGRGPVFTGGGEASLTILESGWKGVQEILRDT
jgi:hypothetical protein